MSEPETLGAAEAVLMLELYATRHWSRRSILLFKNSLERRESLRQALIEQRLADKPAFERIPTWRELFERVHGVPLMAFAKGVSS
jgi:hypothetical protein